MKLIYEMYCVKELENVLCCLVKKKGRPDFSPQSISTSHLMDILQRLH